MKNRDHQLFRVPQSEKLELVYLFVLQQAGDSRTQSEPIRLYSALPRTSGLSIKAAIDIAAISEFNFDASKTHLSESRGYWSSSLPTSFLSIWMKSQRFQWTSTSWRMIPAFFGLEGPAPRISIISARGCFFCGFRLLRDACFIIYARIFGSAAGELLSISSASCAVASHDLEKGAVIFPSHL